VAKARKKCPFHVKGFLNGVDGRRTIATYRQNQKVFSQGNPRIPSFTVKAKPRRTGSGFAMA
jgi:hypothetical protein